MRRKHLNRHVSRHFRRVWALIANRPAHRCHNSQGQRLDNIHDERCDHAARWVNDPPRVSAIGGAPSSPRSTARGAGVWARRRSGQVRVASKLAPRGLRPLHARPTWRGRCRHYSPAPPRASSVVCICSAERAVGIWAWSSEAPRVPRLGCSDLRLGLTCLTLQMKRVIGTRKPAVAGARRAATRSSRWIGVSTWRSKCAVRRVSRFAVLVVVEQLGACRSSGRR